MNAAPRPRLTDQRLTRLSLWLALTIAWFVSNVLARVAPQTAHHMLTRYARYLRVLLVARALRSHAFHPPRISAIPAQRRRLTCRRVAGAMMRRALREGTLQQRAHMIGAILAAPEHWIAYITRRLKRRFTKLHRLPAPRRVRLRAIICAPSTVSAVNSS